MAGKMDLVAVVKEVSAFASRARAVAEAFDALSMAALAALIAIKRFEQGIDVPNDEVKK
jgi:hypothetical protein